MKALTPEQLRSLSAQMDGCPFCGSGDVHMMESPETGFRFECDGCGAGVHFDNGARFAPSLSLARWNRRAAAKKRGFQPPTIDEVTDYIDQHTELRCINPQTFLDYYDARGWKLSNGCSVKDWHALLRRWAHLEKERREKTQVKKPSRRTEISSIDDELLSGLIGPYQHSSLDIDEIEREIGKTQKSSIF